MSTIANIRCFFVLCALVAVCLAFGRLELEDHMQMSRFHEPGKGSAGNNGDDAYLRFLSEYFSRPAQRRSYEPSNRNF